MERRVTDIWIFKETICYIQLATVVNQFAYITSDKKQFFTMQNLNSL